MKREPAAGSMRPSDLVGLAFSALGQQKVRTILTLAGVVIGTFTLIVSLAIGRGIDQAIVALFHEQDTLRKIQVYPKYETKAADVPAAEREPKGTMSEAKRNRLRKAILKAWGWNHVLTEAVPLTPERVDELRRMEHVEAAKPWVNMSVTARFQGSSDKANFISLGGADRILRGRLVAGTMLDLNRPRGAIVSEFLLYRWGIVTDDDVQQVIGKSFQLDAPADDSGFRMSLTSMAVARLALNKQDLALLERALARLVFLIRFLPIGRQERDLLLKVLEGPPESRAAKSPSGPPSSEEFTIIGVIRLPADDDPRPPPNNWGFIDADIYLPTEAAAAFFLRTSGAAKQGFGQLELTIDQEANVNGVAKRVEAIGFHQGSLAELIGTVRMNVLLVTFATAFVALVALLVAALGITNTMIMSVLERTHEIGIMKALGARPAQLRIIFLIEGAVLGLSGALIGLLLAWLASFPGDSIAKSIVEPQTRVPIERSLFLYPVWLVLGAPALVTLITTLAAVYPAHRAASVDPITSLRHE
jgi:putative ABC transport system permease protein